MRVPVLEEKLAQAELLLATTRQQASDLKEALGRISAELKAEREQSEQKLALLLEAKESLTDQFKNLANEILEEKSKRFNDQMPVFRQVNHHIRLGARPVVTSKAFLNVIFLAFA